MAINWFPGHMAKTLRDIQSIKNVDVIIEVVDARAIQTSINKELTKTFNKPKLVVALKSDLSDISDIETTDNLLLGSIKNRKFKNQVIQALDNIFLTKKQQLKSKGLIHPQFYGLVIGLPNVGKSSLINFLGTKTKMVTANLPGVTKNRQLVKINDEYFLYDTAGVLHKRIHNDIDGYKLALIGAIKKEILPLSDVVQWGYSYLRRNYPHLLLPNTNNLNFVSYIETICNKYKFFKSNLEMDSERGINFLYNSWINNLKVNYEKEN